MAQVRKMDENRLDRLLKEITVHGENIRTLQDEKQSLMNDFSRERERFRNGQISERAFEESIRRVSAELVALDLRIRRAIRSSQSRAGTVSRFVETQRPERYRATERGVERTAAAKKKAAKRPARRAARRPSRRKTARKTARRSSRAARRPARRAARRPSRRKTAKRPTRRRSSARKARRSRPRTSRRRKR